MLHTNACPSIGREKSQMLAGDNLRVTPWNGGMILTEMGSKQFRFCLDSYYNFTEWLLSQLYQPQAETPRSPSVIAPQIGRVVKHDITIVDKSERTCNHPICLDRRCENIGILLPMSTPGCLTSEVGVPNNKETKQQTNFTSFSSVPSTAFSIEYFLKSGWYLSLLAARQ